MSDNLTRLLFSLVRALMHFASSFPCVAFYEFKYAMSVVTVWEGSGRVFDKFERIGTTPRVEVASPLSKDVRAC